MSVRIDSLWLEVPVSHTRRRRGKPHAEPETIAIQVHDDAVWLWDEGCQLQSEIYALREERARLFRGVAELPHLDEIYRLATEQRVAHRGDMIGAFLEPTVLAMEDAIAARDGSSVYFIDAGGQIKIGWSKKVSARLAQLQVGAASQLKLLATTPGGLGLERRLHKQFHHLRLSGEWFLAAPELLDHIASLAAEAEHRARLASGETT